MEMTMPTLVVERHGRIENQVELHPLPFKIGKKQGVNHLVLKDVSISREHCVIMKENNQYFIQDLGSRNGTYMNGRRLAESVELPEKAEFHLGSFTLRLTERPVVLRDHSSTAERRTPVELKKKLHEEILATLDLKHTDFSEKTTEEIRRRTSEAARAAILKFDAQRPPWLSVEGLVKEVVDEAVGLGPLEDFLEDQTVDEIMVNGWDKVYIERKGRIVLTDKQFTGNEQVLAVIRRILAPIGRRIDESSPMVDARLADGSRVNAIIPPLCLTGPTITIRKFARTPYTREDLVRFDSVSREMMDFLKFAVENRQNILISGGTGSGKTTFLNILSGFIPPTERIITIEDAAELQLAQEHVVSLESKPPTIEGRGEVPIRKLVINALRMRPDRIVVGECRGGEALDMLQAMNTGHDGSLTTLHANSPRDVLARLETMVLMAGLELPSRAIREQISSAVSLIVHGARLPDGSRKIVNVSELVGIDDESIKLQTIFEFHQTGFDDKGRVLGSFQPTGAVPEFVTALEERGIKIDPAMFRARKGAS
jgi:pilus assembly protein CpaF